MGVSKEKGADRPLFLLLRNVSPMCGHCFVERLISPDALAHSTPAYFHFPSVMGFIERNAAMPARVV